MRCPGCGQWVPEALESCPECQCDVSVLRSVEGLRAALRRTRKDWDAFAKGLAEVEDRASALDPLVGGARSDMKVRVRGARTSSGS